MHSTYKQAEYRIDLLYETNTAKERETAKQLLLMAVSDAGLAVATFKEC
jgi:hypothetical protein